MPSLSVAGSLLRSTCALLLLTGLAGGKTCRALDFTLTGDASAAQEFDTNLFKTLGPHDPVWGQGADGRVDFSVADDRWDSRVNARFANRWYVTDRNLDYFNQLFSWKSQYRSEYSLWKFDSQYNLDNTLTSETDDATDLGYVFSRIPRTTRVLSPGWSYNLTAHTLLNLSYEYRDITYDTQPIEATRVVDSTAHTGALSINHQWNDRLGLSASVSYTDYTMKGTAKSSPALIPITIGDVVIPAPGIVNIPAFDNAIRTTSLMAGFNFAATETITLGFSGGAQYNQNEIPSHVELTVLGGGAPGPTLRIPAISSDAVTEVYTASAKKRFEYSDIGFDYTRSVSPNLQGALVAYDRYSLAGNHRITDRISTTLSLSYSEQSSPSGNSASIFDRDIFTARTSLNWQWDENWVVNTGYQYSSVKYPLDTGTADAHALFLNLRYLFDQHKL